MEMRCAIGVAQYHEDVVHGAETSTARGFIQVKYYIKRFAESVLINVQFQFQNLFGCIS